MGTYRNGDKELRYFGSDLSKFAHENTPTTYTLNNIDLICYKRDKGILRIIESKGAYETSNFSQKELLKIMASLFSFLNQNEPCNIKDLANGFKSTNLPTFPNKFEVFVVRGKPPYEKGAIVEDVIEGEEFRLDRENLIGFLQFENYRKMSKWR